MKSSSFISGGANAFDCAIKPARFEKVFKLGTSFCKKIKGRWCLNAPCTITGHPRNVRLCILMYRLNCHRTNIHPISHAKLKFSFSPKKLSLFSNLDFNLYAESLDMKSSTKYDAVDNFSAFLNHFLENKKSNEF